MERETILSRSSGVLLDIPSALICSLLVGFPLKRHFLWVEDYLLHAGKRFDRLSYDGCTAGGVLVGVILFVVMFTAVLIVALWIAFLNCSKQVIQNAKEKKNKDNLLPSTANV